MPAPSDVSKMTPGEVLASVSKPKAAAPAARKGYQVTCKSLLIQNEAVRVQEGQLLDAPKIHDCVRPVYTATLELTPALTSHPKVTLVVSSLDPLPFEPNKQYLLLVE